jgi:RNA polymerase sigma-70 factor (ECF subfamily)
MASHVGRVVRQLRHLVEGNEPALRDVELLRRFAVCRDEAAFAALVERHGPLVLGLCRRVLQSVHDAEDALQATFLVLARRAGGLRCPDSLAGWLFGVAYRVARKMKAQRGRRREVESKAPPATKVDATDLCRGELSVVLDEELRRLPEIQRQPLLLCYFEGLTQDEAARQLGWPRGTLKSRLERGRAILKSRLARRGLATAAVAAVTASAVPGLAVPPPAGLSVTLARAAALFALRKPLPATVTPAAVVVLAEGVLRSMFAAKLKLLVGFLAATVALVCGAAAFARQTPTAAAPPARVAPQGPAQPPPPDLPPPGGVPVAGQQPKNDPAKDAPPPKGDVARLQGTWDMAEIETMSMRQPGQGATVIFDGDNVTFQYVVGVTLKAKFKLDEKHNPPWIDLHYYAVENLPNMPPLSAPTVGAYKLDGDKLALALGSPAGSPEAKGLPRAGRPTGFQTGPGTGAMVLFLVRRAAVPPGKAGAKQPIPLGRIWTGCYGAEHQPARLVVRDEKQWQAVWDRSMGAPSVTPVSPEPQPLARVDFTKHMVLSVFMGDRENGGHVVDITRIVATAEGWTVYVHEYSPPPGGTPKVTQQPFILVVVPRFEGKVTFVSDDGPAGRSPPGLPGQK